ncbi:hypothetical protein SESBI_11637 [Sesbania bispinosa]|nr:hypothetical protein SESBI_11637 [Sesbania bispinosa]
MASSDVCPTKDAVQKIPRAWLIHCCHQTSIIPHHLSWRKCKTGAFCCVTIQLLPQKTASRAIISGVDSFASCCGSETNLLAHMKFMQKPDETQLVDAGESAVITENDHE